MSASDIPAANASDARLDEVPIRIDGRVQIDRLLTVRGLLAAALGIMVMVGLAMLLQQIQDIVVLVLIAIVFAEGVRPLVQLIERRRVPRPLAILTVYAVLIGALVGLSILLLAPLVSQGTDLVNHFGQYRDGIVRFVDAALKKVGLTQNDVSGQVGTAIDIARSVLLAVGATIANALVDIVLVLLLAFLWLVTTDRLKAFVVDLVPPRHQQVASDVIAEMGFRMGGYLRAIGINMVVIGTLAGLACWILHLPSPLLLGIFAGLAEAIPIAGPFAGAVPPLLLGFTVSPLWPLLVALVFLGIQQIESNTLVPIVMNRVVDLPALTSVLALLIGAAVKGISGALLAVPIAAALQVLVLRVVVPAVHTWQGRGAQAAIEEEVPALGGHAPPRSHIPMAPWLRRLQRPGRVATPVEDRTPGEDPTP